MQDNPKIFDTLVVPASPAGFENVFIGENAWHSFKLAKRALIELKYICVYQTKPVSAITHYAEIETIETTSNKKYIAYFKQNSVKPIGPIKYDHNALTAIQSPRYFNLIDILNAKTLRDLVG